MTTPSPGRFDGRGVLITGGTRGLGRAIATTFAADGANLALTYSSNDPAAEEAAEACRAAGVEARIYKVSVTDAANTAKVVDELVEVWGKIDVLVNNAGVTQNLPIALMDEEDWDFVMDINVKGVFLTSRAVLRPMIRAKGGVILNIGSLAGSRMLDAPVHYCASKAAVSGLTRAMAKSVARHSIRVLCLAPGLLEDGVGRQLPDHRLADYLQHCSLGRPGTFAEVASFAAFLCSDAAAYVSGETIVMDGGV